MGRLQWIIAIAWMASLTVRGDEPIALRDFASADEFRNITLSPDGSLIAATMADADQDDLVVQRLSDGTVLTRFALGKGHRVADYHWANDNRLIIALAEQFGSLTQAYRTGELIGINRDGTEQRYLFGAREMPVSNDGRSIESRGGDWATAWVIASLPNEPDWVVITVSDWDSSERFGRLRLAKLNAVSGAIRYTDKAPIAGWGRFLVDAAGHGRYFSGTDLDNRSRTFSRSDPSRDWIEITPQSSDGHDVTPLALSADGRRAFLLAGGQDGDRSCLIEQSVTDGVSKSLHCDEAVDVSGAVLSFDGQQALAALVSGAPPWERVLATDSPDATRLRALQRTFAGQLVVPVSSSRDGSRQVLLVYSDRNPGDYYLFEPKTMKATYIASRHSSLDPKQMPTRRPIVFESRQGTQLHGFLTLPKVDIGTKPVPLVVNPHGGPIGIADEWPWDADSAVLANHGYAVLQVNFRGSDGFGKRFREAGKKAWDTGMIDDITDGVRWTIAQGLVDPKRICIYGASYGGFAALTSAEREPALYRCVATYAGVYDLNSLRTDADFVAAIRGRRYFQDYIGIDEKTLAAASPLNHLDHLKVPLLVVHGNEDQRAPVNQAKALVNALNHDRHAVESMFIDNEGHGFVDPKNVEAFYATLLAFLDKNIGPAVSAADAAAPLPAPAAPN